jgi:hypothetical protein
MDPSAFRNTTTVVSLTGVEPHPLYAAKRVLQISKVPLIQTHPRVSRLISVIKYLI